MSITDYRKLVRENATKNYKKAPENISVEALTFFTKLKLYDRIQACSTNELCDYYCPLINPAKTCSKILLTKFSQNFTLLKRLVSFEMVSTLKKIQFDIVSFTHQSRKSCWAGHYRLGTIYTSHRSDESGYYPALAEILTVHWC